MPNDIVLEGVSMNAGTYLLLRNVHLSVREKSALIISGRSGCGKSTVLELMAGLVRPHRGRVLWDGHDVATLSRRDLLAGRQKLGYMFQQHALIANYSVFDNIALPLRNGGSMGERDVVKKVQWIMEEVALFGVEKQFPESLSAGQQRRAALARALVTDPDILLLDEPVSGVDEQTVDGIKSVISYAQVSRRRTLVIISHDAAGWDLLQAEHVAIEGGKIETLHRQALRQEAGGTV